MVAIGRRELLIGASALVLTACNQGGGAGAASASDLALGSADAPVTLIEYASVTCGHCATFHEENWEQLKTQYIDTGRVRYILREFPTPPAAIAVAGFQLARCGGASPEQYYTRVGELFRQQGAIFASGSMEGVRAKFIEIGGAAGLTEQQVLDCISDEAGAERIRETVEASRPLNITGTPTFVINGERVDDPSITTWEGLSRNLDAALAGN